jgi:hypothetical protein
VPLAVQLLPERTGRLMMNGVLLTNGLPVINLPASKQLEFNQLMLDFYPSNRLITGKPFVNKTPFIINLPVRLLPS